MRLLMTSAPIALLAASVAPLGGPIKAHAADISSSSTPVATSTADNGSPDDVTIKSDATLSISSGTAVTVDSDNSVTNKGTISLSAADGTVGILVSEDVTGSVSNEGSITLADDYTPKDSANDDDVSEAPFSSGEGRYGVRVVGDLNGDVSNSGSITVQGNRSYGISLEGDLAGTLLSEGSVSLTGDGGAAIQTTGTVGGDIRISGTTSATGQGSSAVVIAGDVAGSVSIYSTVTATGYSDTSRPTTTSALNKIQSTAADLQQGGSALSIQASVDGGVFIGAPPEDTDSDSTEDLDGDGIEDGDEGTATIVSYGSAPAVQIGDDDSAITIGAYGEGDNAYGVIVRGSVYGEGVYDGFSATGLEIGAGGGGVYIEGGVRVVGSITAEAYEADATSIHLLSGAETPTLRIEGEVAATVNADDGTVATATAVMVEAGAQMDSLINYGELTATASGDNGSAVAVQDLSGSLSYVLNTGTITASISDDSTGETVALDLSANTTGVTLRQEKNGDDDPEIVGDILLGSGTNVVELLSGTVTGALDMGSGTGGSILVSGGAEYVGYFSYTGSGLSLQILDGSFTTTNASVIYGSSLTIGSSGVLTLAVDPENDAVSTLELSGDAVIEEGGVLSVRVLSTIDGEETYRLIDADTVTASSDSVQVTTAYLFSATTSVDAGAGTVDVTLRRRSAAEMGMNASESAALDAVYAALSQDEGVSQAILSAEDRDTFISRYTQLLPDHSGDVFQLVSQATRAGGRAAIEHRPRRDGEWVGAPGVWAQEFFIAVDQKKGDGEPYRLSGVGVAAGVESGGDDAALGIAFTAATANSDQWLRPGDSNVAISLLDWSVYGRAASGGWQLDGRLGAGYLSVKSRRTLAANVDGTDISREALGNWNGYEINGRVGLAYQQDFGRYYIRPAVHSDMLMMREGGYAESGGGDGFDLVVEDRSSHEVTVTATVALGADFGAQQVWRPEIELGWAKALSADAGSTTARYAYGGDSFTLTANELTEGAVIAKAGVSLVDASYRAQLQASGEFSPDRTAASLRAAFSFAF